MKGISPLVAVVMLIAFTLIVAGMLAGFVTQLTESRQKESEICSTASVFLRRAVYDPAKNNLTLTTYNSGKVPLRMMTILTYSNETLHPGGIEIYDEKFDVENGKIKVFTVQNVTDDLIEVTIKSTKCDPPCYECSAVQDFLSYTNIRGIGY